METDPTICPPASRPFVTAVLAIWKDVTQKQIGLRTGLSTSQVSRLFSSTSITDALFARLRPSLRVRPAEIAIVTACHEALEATQTDSGLTPEEKDVIELELLEDTRRRRALFTQLVLRSRAVVPLDEYPKPGDVETARWLAREQLAALRSISLEHRVSAVKVSRDLQNWALAEATTEESVEFASRDLKEARVWAEVAVEVAERVQGPEGWCNRVRGYAGGATPNLLRVRGKLDEAETALEEAKLLWLAGSDPDRLLDPGRLLDFEASLLRDKRRFPESLAKLDEAFEVSHHPARILVKKGFTLEVMGEYDQGIATLLKAELYLDRNRDPRLWYKQRSSLAVLFTHAGRYREATDLIAQARTIAIELSDTIDLMRLTWLDGRIAAGQGRHQEALSLLGQAREKFLSLDMEVDAALALVEESALLLDEGRTAEVKALAPALAMILKSTGVHPEAQVALQLFQEAVERNEITSELARHVLRFLFRARYDPGLQFEL